MGFDTKLAVEGKKQEISRSGLYIFHVPSEPLLSNKTVVSWLDTAHTRMVNIFIMLTNLVK